MRMTLPILIGLLIVSSASALAVGVGSTPLPMEQKLPDSWNDLPIRHFEAGLRADTTWFGDYQVIGGVYYARSALNDKAGVMWTFDRGNGPANPPAGVIENGEGWSVKDLTANDTMYFKVIDNTLNLGAGVTPPIIDGARTLWVGADQPQADALCWPCGAGYANGWCQRVFSEDLPYNGSGSVTLNMLYYNDTELCYDGTQIYLLRSDNTEYLLNPVPSGGCPANPSFELVGGFNDSIGHWSAPLTYNRVITQGEIGAAQTINIIIEFKADGGYSDEDCSWDTIYGPFGADNITINGGGINESYNFETGLQGWVPGLCNPIGHFVDIRDVSCYVILDPCSCELSANILEMHANPCDGSPTHPIGQHIQILGPICDSGNSNLKDIFLDFDAYMELPRECGVLIRPGAKFWPWTCDITGAQGFSPRVGQDAYNYFGTDPVCATWRYGLSYLGTAAGDPVPASAQMVIPIIELLGDCGSFTINPCTCPGGNATPLFDNLAVAMTAPLVQAPALGFDIGTRYQDAGSYPSSLFDPRAPVPADVTVNKRMDDDPNTKEKPGDSLVVSGPIPSPQDPNTRWEARMWWRVAKKGAFQADRENGVDTQYKIWRDRVADNLAIDRPYKPQFTMGWMDSAQIGPVPQRNKFKSEFRENDDDYRGEGNVQSEMIWDDVLRPGTRIEYFITSNFAHLPNTLFYFPDTTGQFFFEMDALPGVRTANVPNCGGTGLNYCAYHPATLYIDYFNGGSQFYIENALRTVLNGLPPCTEEEGCTIPANAYWDRYDGLDGSSNWNTAFARGTAPGSSNGFTYSQVIGYRAIILNTGTYSAGATENPDWALFDQWLISPDCGANTNRQVFLMNGDKTGEVLSILTNGLSFLNNTLGAILFCDAFNGFTQDPDCLPENTSYCVQLLPVGGGAFGTLVDVDAWGNYCPNTYGFNVFTPTGAGVGNRTYSAESPPKTMQYEQVVRTNLAVGANYKTVLDGVSWHHMTKRNPAGSPDFPPADRCPRGTPSIVEGSLAEINAALAWGFDVPPSGLANLPQLVNVRDLALCQGTWQTFPNDVDDASVARVNRLYQNEPNPFNARSTISFSLAQSGPVEIVVYDVNGRQVKTLVDKSMDAGTHHVVWDGTNDEGHKVGSGVFWTQMKAGAYTSNKKMVILK